MPLPEDATWDDVLHGVEISTPVVEGYIDDWMGTHPGQTTGSPGYLALGYGTTGRQHKTRVRLCFGADPYDLATMLSEANLWADGLKYALHTNLVIDTWYAYDALGHLIAQTLLAAPRAGLRGAVTLTSNSFTETLTGHGHSAAPGLMAGEARCRWFPDSCTVPARGDKYRVIASDPNILPVAYALATSVNIWADFFGQKAGVRGSAPIQQNAFAQKKWGW